MANIGIIPARYASSRFPGKPLAMIGDKPMIQHVYERCLLSGLDKVVIATDDTRIADAVTEFGGLAVMTSAQHPSGTDRCGEAARILQLAENDIVINIQGDEPFIHPQKINLLISLFKNPKVCIGTLAAKIDQDTDSRNPNIVKTVFTKNKKAIYFSRFAIPFRREDNSNEGATTFIDGQKCFYKHIGIYAYRNSTLQKLILLPESALEKAEKLEQLRWIENDYDIYLDVCEENSISVDTPEDLQKANLYFLQQQKPE